MGEASYKEVASKLLSDLALEKEEGGLSGPANEEMNIKRRVYDALNVLIAVGILKKENRKIMSNLTQRRNGELL